MDIEKSLKASLKSIERKKTSLNETKTKYSKEIQKIDIELGELEGLEKSLNQSYKSLSSKMNDFDELISTARNKTGRKKESIDLSNEENAYEG